MLTLVEKPGKPGTDEQGRSRSSDLINYGADTANFDYDYYEAMAPEPLDLTTKLDRFLIGRSNSSNYSAKWKRDFEQRPTWCDADLSLQAIKRGAATGNRTALYSRSFIQNCLYNLGCFIQHHGLIVLLIVGALFSICCYGLQYVRIETDIVKLWVSEGGRLDAELHYFQHVQDQFANETWTAEKDKYFLREDPDPFLRQRPNDEGAGQGFQVLIQTANEPNENLLTKEGLTRHVDLLQHLVDLKVEKYGVNWTLADICFKPGVLEIGNDSAAHSMKPMLERLVPCIWITPIDCFYEGSKPVGPNPALDTSSIQSYVSLLGGDINIPSDANWGNLNPEEIISVVGALFDLGTVEEFFVRTGIGAGYLDRPCIDPLDPLCPPLAPNYYDACPAMELLRDNLTLSGQELSDLLQKEIEVKKENDFASDLFGIFFGGGDAKKAENETNSFEAECKMYRKSFLHWIDTHSSEAVALFGTDLMPVYPDYGKVMKGGCRGFASSVLNWPEQMILGGVKPVSDDTISAEALQSVILVSTPTDVYKRLQVDPKILDIHVENSTISTWSPSMAAEIISEWQRLFTQSIYNHELNFRVISSTDDGEPIKELKRIVHPLASTSISDMLAEFCDFNYTIIFIGYVLMLIYAVYSQMRLDDHYLPKATSCMGLAVAGVLIVTFASVSGLGLATWFGIEFNAATTQIVPFLTLGIGVDNVFLLLHNYPQVVANVKHSELGVLLKETGMSILMTSTNNIFAFLAGTMLPIPALRSFCTQSYILLTFNLIAVLTIYPAIIGLDLRRRKSGRRDIFCCAVTSDSISDADEDEDDALPKPKDSAYGVLREKPFPKRHPDDDNDEDELEDHGGSWLHAFLRNYYIPFVRMPVTKALIIVASLCLFAIGVIGLQYSVQGLELSDVLPDNTAPAAFLKARDKYFSFYPMSIVLRGNNLDFAHKQHLIENLRSEIGESKFIVKLASNEPSERYWLGLFQAWLIGLQAKLDDAHATGLFADGIAAFDANMNKSISNELRIAVSMVCSFEQTYDCDRVLKGVKLIDASGTINENGFYNYLYAWVEYENMFYTVSQANFYPKLPKLRLGPSNNKYRFFIPPAPQPVYSQIPFYLTGVKDTPGIVAMIKEIRAICDKYAAAGLDNYPSGIAFTFWEQYLDLNQNLMVAISIIAFAVFCVISLLLFNPWAAACIMIILLMMTVELAGFLGLCQIKLNPVSAVSLITAVGLGVEFTAHVVFAFLTSLGTRDERMVACIDRVFVPVIHGALSTLLGILMLGFSEFEFVVKYFFIIMFALIIIGLINGLALLPVLLSLIGPSCEIRPTNGTNRLPVPPALPKHRKDRYDTNGFNNRAHRHPLAINPLGGRDSKSFLPQSPAVLTKAFDNVSSSFRRPPARGHHQLLRTPPSEFVAENNV